MLSFQLPPFGEESGGERRRRRRRGERESERQRLHLHKVSLERGEEGKCHVPETTGFIIL